VSRLSQKRCQMMTIKSIAKGNLRSFLERLGIKSARQTIIFNGSVFTIESLEVTMKQVMYDFGKPSQAFMSPEALKQFKKLT
jgi:hypothetical protein